VDPAPPSPRWPRRAAVLAVALGLAVAYRAGVLQQFAAPATLAQTLVDLGPRGYLAFIVAYALLQPFGVPGTVFVVAAPLIWPWPVAFGLSLAGTMAASSVGFSFARFVGRDWVAARIPARFQRYEQALADRAFATVFLLRLIFWMPPPLHAFFGVSRVPFWTHFWGSLLGYLLPLFVVSYFGQRWVEALKQLPLQAWIGLGVGLALAAFGALAWSWRRRAAQRAR
jgi:uncharacterized membrane protein YdjX (TVP38/TMEM64 family)